MGAPYESNGQQKTGDVYKCPVPSEGHGNCTKLNLGTAPSRQPNSPNYPQKPGILGGNSSLGRWNSQRSPSGSLGVSKAGLEQAGMVGGGTGGDLNSVHPKLFHDSQFASQREIPKSSVSQGAEFSRGMVESGFGTQLSEV